MDANVKSKAVNTTVMEQSPKPILKTSPKKSKKRKRLFEEPSFDLNEGTKLTPSRPQNQGSKIKGKLTPSKSERERYSSQTYDTEDSGSFWSVTESNEGTSICDFEKDEENTSVLYTSVINEFAENEDETSDAHLSVVEEFVDNESNVDGSVTAKSTPKKRKKKVKHAKHQEAVNEPVNGNLEESVDVKTKGRYYDAAEGKLIIIKKRDIIYFHGYCAMSVLYGEVEIFGYKITKDYGPIKAYSPRGSSLLCVSNTVKSNNATKHLLQDLVPNITLAKKVKIRSNSTVVLCTKLEEPSVLFIEKHISQQIFPFGDDSDSPRVTFEPVGNWNLIQVNPEWDGVIDRIDKSTRIMVCGGRGVGKSTFIRYAINRLLMKFDKIRVVDLDPGQSEFTVPGCISIVTVKEPVFGPNYTHLRLPDRSVLSNINIGYEPEKYIASVKYLVDGSVCDMPTLINYMGFTYGVGLNILSAVVACVQPTDVLQIISRNSKKNYKVHLEPDIVKDYAKLFKPNAHINLDYNLLSMESMCDEKYGWTAEPRQLREMCILSYFGHMVDLKSISIYSDKMPTYEVELSQINITDLNGESISPAAANANLVALCSVEKDNSERHPFSCLGWGIVRGVDVSLNRLVLLTPEKLDVMINVTHLVVTTSSLPPSVYMTPDEVVGNVPYVIEGELTFFGQIPKRTHLPAGK